MTATVEPGLPRQRARRGARRARPVLPGRPLHRRRRRRLPAAGRLRLERAGPRAGVHERRGDRRRHRRRRARPRRRRAARRPVLGGARLGPGFFGVVTRFHLRLYPRPRSSPTASTSTRSTCSTRSSAGRTRSGRGCRREMELMLRRSTATARASSEIAVTGPVLADPRSEAREVLALLETCPVLDRAKLARALRRRCGSRTSTPACTPTYPDDHRYAVDNMWTHAPIEELLPGLRRIAETLPQAPSHMLWMNWGPSHPDAGAPGHGLQRRGRDLHRRSTRSGRTPARRRGQRRVGRPTACARWSSWRPASSSPTRTSGSGPRAS